VFGRAAGVQGIIVPHVNTKAEAEMGKTTKRKPHQTKQNKTKQKHKLNQENLHDGFAKTGLCFFQRFLNRFGLPRHTSDRES
jgi:hypothetical protein